jgi:hypothetical protein
MTGNRQAIVCLQWGRLGRGLPGKEKRFMQPLRLLIPLLLTAALVGCGGGGGGGASASTDDDNKSTQSEQVWDKLAWDEGRWQ